MAPEDIDIVDVTTPISDTSTGKTPEKSWGECANLTQLYNNGYTYYMSANGDGDTLEIIDNDRVIYNGKTYGLSAGGNKNYTVAQKDGGGALKFGSEDRVVEFEPSSGAGFKKFTLQKKPKS